MTSNHLLNEILEQPAVLRRIYDAYVYRNNPDLNRAADLINKSSPVHMVGMVTSQFGAMPAAGLLNRAGKLTLVHNAAQLLYYNLESLRSDSCLVTISQSGESAEIVHVAA